MSVRYTSNTAGYNGILPQYTIVNKVSRQLRHSLESETKVVWKVVQLYVVYFNYVQKDGPLPNSMGYERTVLHTSTCLCSTLGMGGVGEEGKKR